MKITALIKLVKFIKNIYTTFIPYKMQDIISRCFFGGTYLSQVEFHVVDHCNLNCAHCDHFTPVSPEYFASVQEVVDDFKKLKKIFDKIGKIYILGGEPLLHPNINEFFEPLKSLYPEAELIVITNGILLNKMPDEFWNSLKKYDVALSMTQYPIKVDYEKYIKKCSELGIKSYFFSSERFSMQKMDLDYKGKQNKANAFKRCWRKQCHFVRDGKLYICTPIPNIKFLNEFFNIKFEVSKSDYIDLSKEKSAAKINKLFSKPVDFCRYCSDTETQFETYKNSQKKLSEWVRDN